MPEWAIAYLVFLALIVLISIIKDVIDQRCLHYISAEFSSGVIGISFIIACWDQYALQHMKKSNYEDLSKQENEDMLKYSKLFAVLFVVPCYIAGLYLSYQLIQNG